MEGVSRRRGTRSANRNKMIGNVIHGVVIIVLFFIIAAMSFVGSSFKNDNTMERSVSSTTAVVTAPSFDSSLVECIVVTAKSSTSTVNHNANGIIEITVRHDLSPIASKVFITLVNAHYFDNVFIFRVLKGFIAQWGVRTTNMNNSTKPPKTKDVVHNKTLSNTRGTLSFAGGNPATRQVFCNLGNNKRLDKENSRPFATLSQDSMHLLDRLFTGYKDGQGQIKTLHQGESAMREKFPKMSHIQQCRVVPAFFSSSQV